MGNALDETQRKKIAMELKKKKKDAITKTEKITNSKLNVQWTTQGYECNEQHQTIMK